MFPGTCVADDAPVLEKMELWKRKAGEEVGEQMYAFTDKDGHQVTLRPEMTPSLARMILSLGDRFLKPVKWFSIPQVRVAAAALATPAALAMKPTHTLHAADPRFGSVPARATQTRALGASPRALVHSPPHSGGGRWWQCWRFETVQRGRKREHYQWNMDIIGEASISAEVELLGAVTSFFSSVGITSADVGIKVNSRKVLSTILTVYGVTAEGAAAALHRVTGRNAPGLAAPPHRRPRRRVRPATSSSTQDAPLCVPLCVPPRAHARGHAHSVCIRVRHRRQARQDRPGSDDRAARQHED